MLLTSTARVSAQFNIENVDTFKKKVFAWAATSEVCCFLDSNSNSPGLFKTHDTLIGVGSESQLFKSNNDAFEDLKNFYEKKKDWLFGFLSYDLKNEVEHLSSENHDQLDFPEMHFFQPTTVIEIKSREVKIHATDVSPYAVFQKIQNFEINNVDPITRLSKLKNRISKSEYIATVKDIKNHIIEGDVYEMNFCQEFFAENISINPYAVFNALNKLSKAPFSCFYKLKNKFLLCASPERYLKKTRNTLISQPIKGTIRRGGDAKEDSLLKAQLLSSEKDQAENVMIVDLVRNDLAKICEPGSVQVTELFGIYPFEQVFQMISTVKGNLKKDIHFVDAIRNTFPMGSMTGAPKVMAMRLIEQYEKSKRGLYSGAVGYITPEGDFDFNVVIRSILYNEEARYVSSQVGGAIVYDSIPEQEYEECLLKAKAMLEVLGAVD
ncbi:MAG: para-aminobenzoate synthetase component 1 [Saprospiraceae bacterium]|jgi:para-aminobenzoate synthetase component 1